MNSLEIYVYLHAMKLKVSHTHMRYKNIIRKNKKKLVPCFCHSYTHLYLFTSVFINIIKLKLNVTNSTVFEFEVKIAYSCFSKKKKTFTWMNGAETEKHFMILLPNHTFLTRATLQFTQIYNVLNSFAKFYYACKWVFLIVHLLLQTRPLHFNGQAIDFQFK